MGLVYADIELINGDDMVLARKHYIGEEDIRFLDGLKSELKEGDTVSIVPAIAGGSQA